ncbi:MAG: tRNA (N(6)-L-threonylcarbamoyladenosine(37)-C(2))-methylthiotransferase MtaB [Acidobacteria bacterium]|nr:tRNA (N(6)-L-threonylcarbamoyladenosine(37)-C(2))-methylthiotransferase MtaB [Acidobacteriota bacterium]
MSSYHVQNFGCRASQADGAEIEALLAERGLSRAGSASDAEFVILNTCTVTATADEEVRQIVRRVHNQNPAAKIIVTGCYAQRAPEELARMAGVATVVGNSHKSQIADLLPQAGAPFHGQVYAGDIFAEREFRTAAVVAAGDRSRPNLKVQDGCNNRCSFCIIPFVRGRSRSAPADGVVEHARQLARDYDEIVLTGINLGRWGRDNGAGRLSDLVRRLLRETDVKLIRLSSVEPMDWSDELLRLAAESPRVARHVHAPLQSGSDAVLRRMHRRYRPGHYEDRILKAREWMPDAAIGADVMAGFPGETEAEFEETRAFLDRLPFTYLHIFPYSERPGTPAAARGDQVPVEVRRRRGRVLKELAAAKNLAFRRAMLGRTLAAVVLEDGRSAVTTNYLKLELASDRPPRRRIEARIGDVINTGLAEASVLPVLP